MERIIFSPEQHQPTIVLEQVSGNNEGKRQPGYFPPSPDALEDVQSPVHLEKGHPFYDVVTKGSFNGRFFIVHRVSFATESNGVVLTPKTIVLQEMAAAIYRELNIRVLDSEIYLPEKGGEVARIQENIPDLQTFNSAGIKAYLSGFPNATDEEKVNLKNALIEEYAQGYVLDLLLNNRTSYSLGRTCFTSSGEVVRMHLGAPLLFIDVNGEPNLDAEFIDFYMNGYEHWLVNSITPEEIRKQIDIIIDNRDKILHIVAEYASSQTIISSDECRMIEKNLEARINYLERVYHEYGSNLERLPTFSYAHHIYHNFIKLEGYPEHQELEKKWMNGEISKEEYNMHCTKLFEKYRERFGFGFISPTSFLYFAKYFDPNPEHALRLDVPSKEYLFQENPEKPISIEQRLAFNMIRTELAYEHHYEYWANLRGITVDKYKMLLQEHIETLVAKSDVYCSVSPFVTSLIISGGRFKTLFEIGTSGSLSDMAIRGQQEQALFGIPFDEHFKQHHPVYMSVSDQPQGVSAYVGQDKVDNLAQYGSVKFKLKRSVAEQRATITFGDSQTRGGTHTPSPFRAPHFTSFDSTVVDPLEHIQSTGKLPIVDIHMASDPLYWEAQILPYERDGELQHVCTLDDIECIYVRADTTNPEDWEKIKKCFFEYKTDNPTSDLRLILIDAGQEIDMVSE